MKIAVVTGCQGFIGGYVVNACLSAGWKVYGIDKMTYAARDLSMWHENEPNFHLIKEDIADLKRLPDCDYVINLAAESHVCNSIVSSKDFIHSNVEGVRNLLELVKDKPENAYGKPLFVHFSTDEVYGDIAEEEGSFRETDALNPSNPYSASKAAADMLIKSYHRTYGTEYVIVRPTNNYGLNQYPEKLVPLCVKLLNANKKIALHNNGTPIRSWLHARDTAEAVMLLLSVYEDQKDPLQIFRVSDEVWEYPTVKNSIFNIGGVERKNKDVVRDIIETYGTPDKWTDRVDLSFSRPGQDVRYSVNDDKLRSLGWEPQADFDAELRNIVKHLKDGRFRW